MSYGPYDMVIWYEPYDMAIFIIWSVISTAQMPFLFNWNNQEWTQICCITFIYKCFNCCKTLLNDLYVPDRDASDGIQTEETDDKETVM